jgi:hypothetical protein
VVQRPGVDGAVGEPGEVAAAHHAPELGRLGEEAEQVAGLAQALAALLAGEVAAQEGLGLRLVRASLSNPGLLTNQMLCRRPMASTLSKRRSW